jgi:hypothetical protein
LTDDFSCEGCSNDCENGCINENTCTPPYSDPTYRGPIIYYDRGSVLASSSGGS